MDEIELSMDVALLPHRYVDVICWLIMIAAMKNGRGSGRKQNLYGAITQ